MEPCTAATGATVTLCHRQPAAVLACANVTSPCACTDQAVASRASYLRQLGGKCTDVRLLDVLHDAVHQVQPWQLVGLGALQA